jgi:ABC-type transporter Mla subunit MlaD
MIEANRYKLGIFVTCATMLIVAVFFFLGIAEIFEKKIRFTTIFNESVQGLETGAPVKLKGVTVGRVTDMKVNLKGKHVRVDMEAIVSAIDPGDGQTRYDKEILAGKIEDEVLKGLRCRLDLSGITGMKYVELDYFPPSRPILAEKPPEGVIYIPSTPSLLSGISSSLSETMARLASINYEEISSELVAALKSINRLVDDPKLRAIMQKLEKISANLEQTTLNINKTLDEAALKEIASKLKTNLDSINSLAKTIKKEVEFSDQKCEKCGKREKRVHGNNRQP